jgi:hypothetical protein
MSDDAQRDRLVSNVVGYLKKACPSPCFSLPSNTAATSTRRSVTASLRA